MSHIDIYTTTVYWFACFLGLCHFHLSCSSIKKMLGFYEMLLEILSTNKKAWFYAANFVMLHEVMENVDHEHAVCGRKHCFKSPQLLTLYKIQVSASAFPYFVFMFLGGLMFSESCQFLLL